MRPYRDSIAAGLSAALVSGAVMTGVDLVLAARRGGGLHGSGAELAALVAGLYAMPCVLAGAAAGVIVGAWRATFGDGAVGSAYRRLCREPELDRQMCGALIATAVSALALAAFTAALATKLVAGVERKSVGAVLFGVTLAASLPLFAVFAIPVFRVTRKAAIVVPRAARVPATMVISMAGVLAAAALVVFVVSTRLDWRALDLGGVVALAVMLATALAWTGLWRLLLPKLRRRIPVRGFLAAGAAVASLALSALVLRAAPSREALQLLTEHTSGARKLLAVARALSDHDGDGYSALIGGPDCDDEDPDVHPDATEIPDNGKDDNCLGGDRVAAAATADTEQPSAPALPQLGFHGNLLFVVIDTMRGDRLGLAGYRRNGRSLTPNLDELGARACYFRRAYAQATNTARSVPSMFTSLYPSQVRVDKQFRNFSRTLDENLSMFEVLEQAGVHTVGFSSHYFFQVNEGSRQGFIEYDNEGAKSMEQASREVTAPKIVTKAMAKLTELSESGERFAMFVHLFEAHSDYVEHAEFPLPPGAGLRARYDYELAFDDLWVGRLLDTLQKVGLAEHTMVVVLADHGEGFGEHRVAGQRIFYHGRTLYQELLHVPLLIHIPGVAPCTIDTPVMLLDVAPTIVSAMGIDVPSAFHGRSLLPGMRGVPLEGRPVFAELLPAPYWNHSAKAMISADGRYKLIYRISERRFELYDLAQDPGESRDLYRRRPDIAESMTQALIDWIEVRL